MDSIVFLLTDPRFSLVLSPIVASIYLSLIVMDVIEHTFDK